MHTSSGAVIGPQFADSPREETQASESAEPEIAREAASPLFALR
jgi:hypothetical protein